MDTLTIVLFGLVVLTTHFLEGITGFGCTVLAMPFAILLTGINVAKPVLTIYGLLLCLYIVIISYKDIAWKHYFRIIAFMGLGLPVGMWLFNKLPEDTLKNILAVFMIIISIRGLINSFREDIQPTSIKGPILNFILFIGGCIHGAFTSGGPLVIIYAAEKLQNKASFRATLCFLWVTLNSIIIAQSAQSGAMTTDVIKLSLYALPFLIIGALLGNWAHHKIKDGIFTKIVYIVLFVSAIFMFI